MASRSILSRVWRVRQQPSRQQIRRLTLGGHQAHEILKEFGIPVSRGKVAQALTKTRTITEEFDGSRITKPQTLKSSRCSTTDKEGSEGSIGRIDAVNTAGDIAKNLLGHQLKAGRRSRRDNTDNKFFVTELIEHEAKWYLAITFDRENYCPSIIASKRGGFDIDTTVKQHSKHLNTFKLGYTEGITSEVIQSVSRCLGASEEEAKNLHNLLRRLYEFFTTKDATLVEINSLAKSFDGTLTCRDARLMFDDAAGKRQKDIFSMRDTEHEVPDEVEAEKYGLVYVRMDGDIGNVVNGAGLAMATNDAIALHGGANANFLDAGGQATTETMVKAFEIILRDERVKAILVNIYGGITRGDMIAESILGAAKQLGPLRVPMVVRLQGTNSELGLRILEKANLGLHTEADFGKAAERAVELAKWRQ
ncbi:Putative succinate--CoA synthetase, beta subunit, ATP-citrate lyase/succinyl-CoA ligase [Colletotrichum destructivum]|uniref:Succinate--CoA synthetase, beta subunit, ATP-citrate lyase/succinyl-CoA ligase n=1 Tax=Colletotrichum destructivum TaxID=34406 RepID=A0AAX4IZ04_9PEZI|nr:Putative succinate--CoA synthetase, beta subunit, ATP-citrate lyase/succinyl-CoA ligase [Colletotrichum destructivum]